MDAHEVLVAGRNLLDRHGWVQGDLGGENRGFCLVGAVNYAACGNTCGVYDDASSDAYLALKRTGSVTDDEVTWNNQPGRTKAEVLAAFDQAISATAPEPADPFPSGVADEQELVSVSASGEGGG